MDDEVVRTPEQRAAEISLRIIESFARDGEFHSEQLREWIAAAIRDAESEVLKAARIPDGAYLVTRGSGEDGDEWHVLGIYSTREKADRAKVDLDTEKHMRPDGSHYFLPTNDVEDWALI